MWWGLATDGPFGTGNAAVALQEVQRLYWHKGWELPASEDLYHLAEDTAAGLVPEEDIATWLHEQVRPRRRRARRWLSRRWGPFRR